VPRTPGRRCCENIKSQLSLFLVACLSFHRSPPNMQWADCPPSF
jgi:hypothetical protein